MQNSKEPVDIVDGFEFIYTWNSQGLRIHSASIATSVLYFFFPDFIIII